MNKIERFFEMFHRDYFYISLIMFIFMTWSCIHSWNFSLSSEPAFISIKKLNIQNTLLYPIKVRNDHFLIIKIGNKQAKAACNKVGASSENYKIICANSRIGQVIQAKNIEFLDLVHPRQDGLILKGDFLINGKNVSVQLGRESKYVASYILFKKISITIIYALIFMSLAYMLLCLYVLCYDMVRFIRS